MLLNKQLVEVVLPLPARAASPKPRAEQETVTVFFSCISSRPRRQEGSGEVWLGCVTEVCYPVITQDSVALEPLKT